MEQRKIAKIKAAVKGHFEQSPDHYQAFEDRYGFFRALNEALLSRMKPPDGAKILDVGCGTGSSSGQIVDTVQDCRVWGLDNSPAMLEAARAKVGESGRLRFVEGDGARLGEYFDFHFDAIVYSASIFLMPDYEESLRQARDLLKPGGCVGLTFMDGVFDPDGKNALAVADRDAGLGVSLKKPVKLFEFLAFFEQIFPRRRTWQEDMRLPEDLLRDFFSVPAMSAGLFPGLEYPERLTRVNSLFDHLPRTENCFRWVLVVGEKG